MTLSKQKWDEICREPERYFYRHNGDKVGTTLIAPDMVRHHGSIDTQFIYYKHFDKIMLGPAIEVPSPVNLMAVVVDTATGRVCTIYPTDKPKAGKEYDHNA
jgi:hypothetical protein